MAKTFNFNQASLAWRDGLEALPAFIAELDALGAQGWEGFAVTPLGNHLVVWLKREGPETP